MTVNKPSDRQKYCPKCNEIIPRSFPTHFKCGWSSEDTDTGRDSSVSPVPKSETRLLMKESVGEVCSIFDMSLGELKENIERYSSVINTIFISKRNGR